MILEVINNKPPKVFGVKKMNLIVTFLRKKWFFFHLTVDAKQYCISG